MTVIDYIGRQLQWEVDATVSILGGYWPPLSGLARVFEELGEFAEVLSADSSSHERLTDEVADLLIITTCLANQYSNDLSTIYPVSKFDELVERPDRVADATSMPLLASLVARAAELSRVVNAYEGSKTPKANESLRRIGPIVADLHGYLCAYAVKLNLDVEAAVREKLRVSRERDRNRFASHYDPSNALPVRVFRRIKRRTQCTFADAARLCGAPAWDLTLDVGANLSRVTAPLERFARIAPLEGLDGFVIALPSDYGEILSALARTTRVVLEYFAQHDPAGEDCMAGNIATPGWHFRYAAVDFFIATFAPCYPPSHARYAFDSHHTFILLQPESSFKERGLGKNPETAKIRMAIRRAYEEAGSDYDGPIIRGNLEAPRYVKPLQQHDPPVEWWKA